MTEAAVGTNGKGKRRKADKAPGRQERDGQEAVTRPDVVADKIDHLERLEMAARTAAKDASDAIKKVAEASGYTAATLKKLVVARVSDKFGERLRDTKQQLELFTEVGE